MSGREPIQKKEEKQVEKKAEFVIAEVSTQSELVITNKNNEKETYNTLTAICKIMNDIEELKEKIK